MPIRILILFLLSSPCFLFAQVGIGTSTPNASAQLDVSSTTKGFLPPRMTQAQRQGINSPTAGLMVYQTDGTAGLWYYTGNAWIYIINSTSATLPVANGGTGETTIVGVKSILGLNGASVAIGSDAGTTTQGSQAIAIGSESGKTTQGVNAIAIGSGSGRNSQGLSAIGIGYVAGDVSQGSNAIAIGSNAAQSNQATQAVAIGYAAGQNSQGANAVAIGSFAGNNGQTAGSIAINASGVALNPTNAGLYINPIRSAATTNNYLHYDATTKEVTHSSGLAAGSVSTTTIIDGAVTDAKIETVSGSKVTGNISGNAANVTGTVAVANGGTGASNGSITGTGALTFTAGGTNQNVTLTPSGTGGTILNGNVGIGTASPSSKLDVIGNVNLTGVLNVGSSNGDEGGEISLALAQTNTILTGNVVVDVYRDKLRIFEGTGNNRGVSLDLSKAPNGNAGELIWKVSGFVNAGTFLTLDNLKVSVTTTSDRRGLSIGAVSTSFTANISAWYSVVGGANGGQTNNVSITTTASSSINNWHFGVEGDGSTYDILDKTNNRFYRVTLMIGFGYNNNFISIERLY